MADKKSFCAVPKDGGWIVKRLDTKKVLSFHATQAEAWKETRRLARGAGSEAYLHRFDGKVKTSNSYNDTTFST